MAEGFRIMVYTGSSSEEVRKIKEQVKLLCQERPFTISTDSQRSE
jgi:hypothetical protein